MGGIDGAVTTFAFVAGSIGADLSTRVILVVGVANLLADGFSMAAANYSGSKSENEDFARLRAVGEKHIAIAPDDEREEIRQIFLASATAATGLTALAFFVIGSLRTRRSQRHWLSCGVETTAIGTFAVVIDYLAGHGLRSLLG